jgi:hypothetical protein
VRARAMHVGTAHATFYRWCVVDTVGAMADGLRCKQLPSTFILLPT